MFLVIILDASCERPKDHRGTLAFHPLRAAILEKMPLVERDGPQADEEAKESKAAAQLSEAVPAPTEPQASQLLDLLDLLDGASGDAQHPPPLDPSPGGALVYLLDLPCAPPPPAPIPDLKVFEREGVQLNLSFIRPPENPALLLITATATNSSEGDVTDFICQAAVPKVCKDQGSEVAWGLQEKRPLSGGGGWETV